MEGLRNTTKNMSDLPHSEPRFEPGNYRIRTRSGKNLTAALGSASWSFLEECGKWYEVILPKQEYVIPGGCAYFYAGNHAII
jgi:hypothetical protein